MRRPDVQLLGDALNPPRVEARWALLREGPPLRVLSCGAAA
jgi:hypothetical protein